MPTLSAVTLKEDSKPWKEGKLSNERPLLNTNLELFSVPFGKKLRESLNPQTHAYKMSLDGFSYGILSNNTMRFLEKRSKLLPCLIHFR